MKILFYGYGNHAKRIKKYLDEYIYIPKSYCFINKSKKKLITKIALKLSKKV